MARAKVDEDETEVVDLDDAVKMIKRKVMNELEPLTSELKRVGEEVRGAAKATDLTNLLERTEDNQKIMRGIIEDLEKIKNMPAPMVDVEQLKAELRAELTPLIKAETQVTFREVLQRFGVKPSTLDSGDMNAIIGELIPLLMPAVMGSGGLAALAGKHASTPETVDIKPKPELSDAEARELKEKCQTCGAPLKVRSSENECDKCGAMNYAYRCYACKEVYLTILAPEEIGGTECPLCGACVKSSKRR